jgi:hypothetical protein
MIGKLIMLVVLFTIGWLVYANFFGTEKEKEMARGITNSFTSLVGGITGAIKHEADKGTFTKAFEKTTEAIGALKNGDKNGDYSAKIAELEAERQRLETQLEQGKKLKSTIDKATADEKTKQDLNNLADKINTLSTEMQKNKK